MNHDFEEGPTRKGRFGKAGFFLVAGNLSAGPHPQGTILKELSARNYPQGTIRAAIFCWWVGCKDTYIGRWVHFPKGDKKEKVPLICFVKKRAKSLTILIQANKQPGYVLRRRDWEVALPHLIPSADENGKAKHKTQSVKVVNQSVS